MTTQAVLRVGDGRGFVAEYLNGEPVIITAAHCLPALPARHPGRFNDECTYRLLGNLDGEPRVWAECLFVDQ